MIFLDTHVALWLYAGTPKRISQAARQAINREADLRVSPMVVFEIGILAEHGVSRDDPDTVIRHLASTIGLRVCDHPWPDIAKNAVHLTWTRDPFDRLITAHALTLKAGLVTADATLHEHYPKAVW